MGGSKQTRGACAYCGRDFTRSGMARHLGTCEKRKEIITATDQQPGEAITLIHLQVQPPWGSDYWLHLEVNGPATLKNVDQYLRAIWLECCGHLSRFSFGGWGSDEIGKGRKVADVFQAGVELTHIYDFGSESVTLLKAVDTRKGKPTTRHPIALMARNETPVYTCQECEHPATYLCLQCAYDEEKPGTLCDRHAETHPHDDYGDPMPLVNSPRTGVCGYDGPAEPPY